MFGKPSLVSQIVRSMKREPSRWREEGHAWVRDDGLRFETTAAYISAWGKVTHNGDSFRVSSREAWRLISASIDRRDRENRAAGKRITDFLAKKGSE